MRIHRPKYNLLNLCALGIFFLYNLPASFVREGKEIKNFNLNYFSYRSLDFLGPLNIEYLILGS